MKAPMKWLVAGFGFMVSILIVVGLWLAFRAD
jgi:hypothetical protein